MRILTTEEAMQYGGGKRITIKCKQHGHSLLDLLWSRYGPYLKHAMGSVIPGGKSLMPYGNKK